MHSYLCALSVLVAERYISYVIIHFVAPSRSSNSGERIVTIRPSFPYERIRGFPRN